MPSEEAARRATPQECAPRSSHRAGRPAFAGAGTGAVAGAVLALAGCAAPAPMQRSASESTLQVTVTQVVVGSGPVRCAAYTSERTFLTRDGIHFGQSHEADANEVTVSLRVPAGQPVAISVFQDTNSNESLDRGAFGIPSEPWGFSGKPSAFGPPRWKDCAITPTPGQAVVIALRGGGARRPQD